MDKITKDTVIGDIVNNHPEVIDTLTSFGVHCVGCGAMHIETVEMGFKGHGMTDEEVETAIAKLNEVAEEHAKNNSEESKESTEKVSEESTETVQTAQ